VPPGRLIDWANSAGNLRYMLEGEITVTDPRAGDVRALLERHLELMHAQTPPEDVHALDVAGLLDPAVTFLGYRRDGTLLGVGAIKQLDEQHGELKSMHTAAEVRGRGIGRAMLDHLIALGRARDYGRLSLETGSTAGFEPARALYASAGFVPCGPFGEYQASASSVFMTLVLIA
jgi:putative acetyltransferase